MYVSFCRTAVELIKFTGDQGIDTVPILQDPDLDADDVINTGIVDTRLGMVHSAVKLACVPGTSLRSQFFNHILIGGSSKPPYTSPVTGRRT